MFCPALESLQGRSHSPCQIEVCIFHSNIPHLSGAVWAIAGLSTGEGGIEAGVQDRGVLPVAAYSLELAHNVQLLRGPDVDTRHSTAPVNKKDFHSDFERTRPTAGSEKKEALPGLLICSR